MCSSDLVPQGAALTAHEGDEAVGALGRSGEGVEERGRRHVLMLLALRRSVRPSGSGRRWVRRRATLQVMVLVLLVAAAGIVLVVLAAIRNRGARR